MGIAMRYVKAMEQRGLFTERAKILDIGSSNLYSAEVHEVLEFIDKYHPRGRPSNADTLADKLAAGSYYDPVYGGTNKAFIGELFEAGGMEYLSLDIAQGYRTRVLDMNREDLPPQYRGHFDLVLNYGTTEHVFNQVNSFKIMHEAARVGGYIVHQVPSIGFTDHCYFTYTSRFFCDFALCNQYEIVDFWYDGPAGEADVFHSVRNGSSRFPLLRKMHEKQVAMGSRSALNSVRIPNIAITVICRKVKDQPFVEIVETTQQRKPGHHVPESHRVQQRAADVSLAEPNQRSECAQRG